MIRVIEMTGKSIPDDVYGVAHNCGKRLLDSERSISALMYGKAQIIAKKQGDYVNVLVITTGGNFGCVPRIFGKNDGYGPDGIAIGEGKVVYPLSNNTLTVSVDDKSKVEVSRDGAVFGNIDWKGKNTAAADEPSNAPILTWKGPTGRSIPFDYTKPIEGLTTPDIVFSETDEKFTCFGPDIYEGGSVAFTAVGTGPVDTAPKVLGCAYQGNTLVCIVVNHYPDRIGFFEEVWVTTSGGVGLYDEKENPGGWRLLSSRSSVRPTMIWAFNQSGTKATQGVSEYSIDLAAGAATLDAGTNTNISYILDNSNPNGDHSTVYSGSTKVWSDYKGDERVFAEVVASGGHKFTTTFTASSTKVMAPVFLIGDGKGTATVNIIGNQATATVTGTSCSCEGIWSISGGGTISGSGVITPGSGCGTGTVTYSCGSLTATAPYKYASGTWVLTDCYFDSSVPSSYLQTIGGGASDLTKIVEYYGDSSYNSSGSPFQQWNENQKKCIDATSGVHCGGCVGVPSVGTSYIITGLYYTDPHGCVINIFPWDCNCWGSRCKLTYSWGCAGDIPVANTCV